jgi:hypothetical protein|tara:strand:+ start:288 stop:413 length:126 start_codon:yes stop_codon:yes gene_type:complete
MAKATKKEALGRSLTALLKNEEESKHQRKVEKLEAVPIALE